MEIIKRLGIDSLPSEVIFMICKNINKVQTILTISKLLPHKVTREDVYRIVRPRFRNTNDIVFYIGMSEFINTCIHGSIEDVADMIDILDMRIEDIRACNCVVPWHLHDNEEEENILTNLLDKMKPKVVKLLMDIKFIPICSSSVFKLIRIGDLNLLDYWIKLVNNIEQCKRLVLYNGINILIACTESGNTELFRYFARYLDLNDTSKMNKYLKESGYNFLYIAIKSKSVNMVKLLMTNYVDITTMYVIDKKTYHMDALNIAATDILKYFATLLND